MMRNVIEGIKGTIRPIVPERWCRQLRLYRDKRWDNKFRDHPLPDVFSAIYKEAKWGAGPQSKDFHSGNDPEVLLPHVEAVRAFFQSLPNPPSVVDLGCGDFYVGSKLRPYCEKYIACDVVPELISRNRAKFSIDVDFRCLDITRNDLPIADIAVLKQVLQHLSNAQILKILPKLYAFKALVLTEHIPSDPDFTANVDKAAGAMVRLSSGSGIVLTQPPFNLKVKLRNVICSTPQALYNVPGVIQTIQYEF